MTIPRQENILIYSILALCVYVVNATKEAAIDLILLYPNYDNYSYKSGLLFLISFIISLFLLNKKAITFSRLKRKEKEDLRPYFSNTYIKKSRKTFVVPEVQSVSPAKYEEPKNTLAVDIRNNAINFFIKQVFNSPSEKYYLIMAGAGMGKTTFLLNLYFAYLNIIRFKLINAKYNIIFIPLNSLDGLNEIKGLKNNIKKNTILLLDSLDEDPKAIESISERLKEITEKTWQFRNVIITSRTQFFPDEAGEPNDILIQNPEGTTYKFNKIYLSPLTRKKCFKIINKRYNIIFNYSNNQKASKLIEKHFTVLSRPMLLDKVEDLFHLSEDSFNEINIYKVLIKKWINREAEKQLLKTEDKEKFKKELYLFSQYVFERLMVKLQLKEPLYLSREEVLKYKPKSLINITEIQLTSKSLLNRDSSGNWKFSHKSIFEYFAAINKNNYKNYIALYKDLGLDYSLQMINNVNVAKFNFNHLFPKKYQLIWLSPTKFAFSNTSPKNATIFQYERSYKYIKECEINIDSEIFNCDGLQYFMFLETLEVKNTTVNNFKIFEELYLFRKLQFINSDFKEKDEVLLAFVNDLLVKQTNLSKFFDVIRLHDIDNLSIENCKSVNDGVKKLIPHPRFIELLKVSIELKNIISTKLISLQIEDSSVTLSDFSNCSALSVLKLRNCKISNEEYLSTVKKLDLLDLIDSEINSIDFLTTIESIGLLKLSFNEKVSYKNLSCINYSSLEVSKLLFDHLNNSLSQYSIDMSKIKVFNYKHESES